jgi:excisionase family DNA binding protein
MHPTEHSPTPKALLEAHEALTVAETCDVLRISRPTLYRHIRDGKLTAFKVGARTLFRTEDLRRLLGAAPYNGGASHAA